VQNTDCSQQTVFIMTSGTLKHCAHEIRFETSCYIYVRMCHRYLNCRNTKVWVHRVCEDETSQ